MFAYNITTLFLLYLCYLILDGTFRLFKIIAIIAEYGFITTVRATVNLTTSYLRKPFGGGNDFIWRIINKYIIDNYKLIIILVTPTIIIDYIGSRIAFMCAYDKASNKIFNADISFADINIALIQSQLIMGYADAGKPLWALKLPSFLGNAFFILEYHFSLLLQLFPSEFLVVGQNSKTLLTEKRLTKDIFGCSALPKIIRLISFEILVFLTGGLLLIVPLIVLVIVLVLAEGTYRIFY